MNTSRACSLSIGLLVLLASAGALAAPAKAPVAASPAFAKLALLVGIDRYGPAGTPKVAGDQQWKPLAGATNDVAALAAELTRRGFDVRTLVDAEATHEGIVRAFREQLIAKSQPGRGDVVMFHFSGHGQQIPDDDGDEVDGYDEALVPFDNRGTQDGSNHLRDDELGELIAQLDGRADQIVVTLDACHSGTGTRGVYAVRGGPPSGPPAATARDQSDDGPSGLGRARSSGQVVLTATRPDELAAEARDTAHDRVVGAFSQELVRALRGAGPTTTWRQVMDRIGVGIVAVTDTQHPQIEGDRDMLLFSGRWALPPAYALARPALPDGRIPIEAGLLHGLAVGSELGLYALGTSDMDPDEPPVRVRVESVEPVLAYAKPMGTVSAAAAVLLRDGAQALELVTPQTPRRLRVSSTDASLKKVLASLAFVSMVDAREVADVRVEASKGSVTMSAADGTRIRFPRGPEEPMDDALPRDTQGFESRLVTALELHWRRSRLAGMINDDPRAALSVSLELHRVEAEVVDGEARVTKDLGALAKSGAARVQSDDIVQFRVKNSGDRVAYVTILELATDGSIVVWYPDAMISPVDTALAPGAERAISPPFVVTPPAGEAIYKLVATSMPVDLGGLTKRVQSGGSRGSDHPVALLLEEVASPTRARPFAVSKKERWGTDEARIVITK